MVNCMIRLIRSYEYSAEKEFIKEFFRLIGCLFTEVVVDWNDEIEWSRKLEPDSQGNVVDIVLNYYGNDPYEETCKRWDVPRLYCFTDFAKKTFSVRSNMSEKSDSAPILCDSKKELRKRIIEALVSEIWRNHPDDVSRIHHILDLYCNNTKGDLFYFLQAKHCFRILSMSEVLNEPNAQIPYISMTENPYIREMLAAMWEFRTELESLDDYYSIHAQADADCMIRCVASSLPDDEWDKLPNNISISHKGVAFRAVPVSYSTEKLWNIIDKQPGNLPGNLQSYLMLACLYHSIRDYEMEERCLKYVVRCAPEKSKGYAFVNFRLARFYEKSYKDYKQAKEYYRISLDWNPENYQALFKLAYFAERDGRATEAQTILERMISVVFRGKSIGEDEDGNYPAWDCLTLRESQYIFKASILWAKIADKQDRVYSAKAFIGRACLAATSFSDARIFEKISDGSELVFTKGSFSNNQRLGKPAWAMWVVLQRWSEYIIRDDFVRHIVRERLQEIAN